jgi:hypothetical protein
MSISPFAVRLQVKRPNGPPEPETKMRKIMALGPYLMLEIFMPGGTLLALLLYLARRRYGSDI